MVWPFRRKDALLSFGRKSASFLFGMAAYRSSLTKATYQLLADEGYASNAVVHACITKISAAIASVEPQLYRRNGGKLVKIETHPLLDLINSPNDSQSGKEFFRHLTAYYLTSGNAYVFGNGINPQSAKSKPPVEIQLLNPASVVVKPGATLFPLQYEYKPDPQKPATIYPVNQVTGNSQVLQFKTFNPLNAWYGLPPMLAAAFSIDIYNGGQKWNKRLLDNDARPSGALRVTDADGKPTTLSDEQYERLKEQISDQYSGAANAGRPMLLEGGLDWKEMSLSPQDLDFLKGKDSAARDIGLVFGVPSQLLQIPGDSTFANYEQATLSFWSDTVLPLLGVFLEGFNRWLAPLYGDDLFLWYDEDTIPALEPRRKEKFVRVQQAEFMTIDEKRRTLGMDDFPNDLGKALVLSGRGVMLGEDGSIVALATTTNTDPGEDPLIDPNATQPEDPNAAAKFRTLLAKHGYTPERIERLAKLTYE